MAILTTIVTVVAFASLLSGRSAAGTQGSKSNDDIDLETLKANLQGAIQLEWATIPVYLNAAFSIKDGTNQQVSDMLWGILVNEMHHMSLAANMLNAIGGKPLLNDPKLAPRYPGPLPAGALPELQVTLQKMTKSHTKKVLMGIETPECHDSVRKFHDPLIKAMSQKLSPKSSAHQDILAKCMEENYIPDTIGAIYIHKILCPMVKLEKTARSTIFTGDQARQVQYPFKVTNIDEAIKGVAYIVSQGEGGDPCNPYVDPEFADDKGNEKEPCHYFKFAEIVHGREVESAGNPCPRNDPGCTDYFSPCDDDDCNNIIRFNGPAVELDESQVWPIKRNPSTKDYPSGSKARWLSDGFNVLYVDLMQCLHDAVNGQPDNLKKCVDKMHCLRGIADVLVKTPIDPEGDPNVGPNVAPTYEFFHRPDEMASSFRYSSLIFYAPFLLLPAIAYLYYK